MNYSKTFTLITCSAALSWAVFSPAFAEAPVVDIANNSDHMQLAANTNAPAKVTDVSDNNSDDSANNTDDSTNTADDSAAADTAATDGAADSDAAQAGIASLPLPQQIVILSKQIKNLTAMNLPQQISDLQNQIQQLRGQLQVQSHDLQLLNNQQRSFYQDVDQRIQQLKILVNSNGSDGDSSSSSSNSTPSKPSAPSLPSDKELTTSEASSDFNLKDAKTYQTAFAYVLKKQFDKAENGFEQYLQGYPNGRYAANAHYWLGEIYLRKNDTKQAEQAFKTVVKDYASSSKVSDSKLKLAMIHMSQGKTAQAKTEYQALKQQYPGTTAAQLASIQLQQIAASQNNDHVQ